MAQGAFVIFGLHKSCEKEGKEEGEEGKKYSFSREGDIQFHCWVPVNKRWVNLDGESSGSLVRCVGLFFLFENTDSSKIYR